MDPENKLEDMHEKSRLTPGGEASPPQSQEGHIPPSHEASFTNMKTLIIAGVGLFVVVLLISGLAGLLTAIFGRGEPVVRGNAPTPPGPNLQVAPRQDLDSYLATQKASLDVYGWVNKEAGTVRIPIQQAMELLAERGLPYEERSGGAIETGMPDDSGFATTPTPGGSQGTP